MVNKPEWMPKNSCDDCKVRRKDPNSHLLICSLTCRPLSEYIGLIATAKALAKWADEPCTEHPINRWISEKQGIFQTYPIRRVCPDCWEQMLKELEEIK